jgi:hypothetical protein
VAAKVPHEPRQFVVGAPVDELRRGLIDKKIRLDLLALSGDAFPTLADATLSAAATIVAVGITGAAAIVLADTAAAAAGARRIAEGDLPDAIVRAPSVERRSWVPSFDRHAAAAARSRIAAARSPDRHVAAPVRSRTLAVPLRVAA